MVSGYARLPLPIDAAIERFRAWVGLPELEPPRPVRSREAFAFATTTTSGDDWRGVAVWVHAANGWTVFDDYTGYLGSLPAPRWIELAGDEELVFAGYSEGVPYGQLIVVRDRRIVREFLHDLQDPSQNVNRGRLEFERSTLIDDWVDAAYFVDGDELADDGANEGILLLFEGGTSPDDLASLRSDDR
jgi:hypothetical protein